MLARQGLSVADIAKQIGVRYQHAYNVLKHDGLINSGLSRTNLTHTKTHEISEMPQREDRPPLTVDYLIQGGFNLTAQWLVTEETLHPDKPLPKERGVYAFVLDGRAVYVGLATMGLAKRLYFYGRPGTTQRTSLRLNELLRNGIRKGTSIEIYTATPPTLSWNGLPICGDAGLERGLIDTYHLPWNIAGSRSAQLRQSKLKL